MSTFALLGATGATGSAILRYLLDQPPAGLTLNVFIRSKSKLLKLFPDVEKKSEFKIRIIEGNLDDGNALQSAIKDADIIFMCIATNVCTPDTSVAQDVANGVIGALETLRSKQAAAYKTPTLLVLRSRSLNDTLNEHESQIIVGVLKFFLHYVYDDLDKACTRLQRVAEEHPGLLEYILVDPPGLHDADGTERTGFSLMTTGRTTASLSYSDLGAAFCEIANKRHEYLGQAVGISATGKVNETWGTLIGYISQGAKSRIIG